MVSSHVQPLNGPQSRQLWLNFILFELTISFLFYVFYAFVLSFDSWYFCQPPLYKGHITPSIWWQPPSMLTQASTPWLLFHWGPQTNGYGCKSPPRTHYYWDWDHPILPVSRILTKTILLPARTMLIKQVCSNNISFTSFLAHMTNL